MKKVLAIVLAAVLLLGLAVPALAAEPEKLPLWQAWGYASQEAMQEEFKLTPEEYAALEESIHEMLPVFEAIETIYDAETHDLIPPVYVQAGYESKDLMLSELGMTEEQYAEIVDTVVAGVTEFLTTGNPEAIGVEPAEEPVEEPAGEPAEEPAPSDVDAAAAYGLTNSVNLMVQGNTVDLAEGVLVNKDGAVMAQAAPFAKAMGMKYDRDLKGDVVLYNDDITITMPMEGDPYLLFTAPEYGGMFELEAGPYLDGGKVYIPVAPIGEALGYEVEWSSAYNTVVFKNVAAIAADIDANYSILNGILRLGKNRGVETNYTGKAKLNMTLHMDGKDYRGSLIQDAVMADGVAYTRVRVNLRDLVSKLLNVPQMTPDMRANLRNLEKGIEIIADSTTGITMLRAPMLDAALAGADAGAWYSFNVYDFIGSIGGLNVGGLNFGGSMMDAQPHTVGELLMRLCDLSAGEDYEPVLDYANRELSALMLANMSDSAFEAAEDGHLVVSTDFAGLDVVIDALVAGGEVTEGTVVVVAMPAEDAENPLMTALIHMSMDTMHLDYTLYMPDNAENCIKIVGDAAVSENPDAVIPVTVDYENVVDLNELIQDTIGGLGMLLAASALSGGAAAPAEAPAA